MIRSLTGVRCSYSSHETLSPRLVLRAVALAVGRRQALRERVGEEGDRDAVDVREGVRDRVEGGEVDLAQRVALRVGELGGGDEPPVAGAEGRLVVEPPGEADARHEPAGPGVRLPLAVRLREVEGAVVGVARGARRLGHHRPDVGGDLRVDRLGHPRDRVREVELLRQPVLGVPQAALVLVAEPQVERDLLGDLPVVLDVEAVELRVRDLQLPVLHVRGAGVHGSEQEARPGVPGGGARARPAVGGRGRHEAQVGVEEARRVAPLPADLGAGLDRVLVQVLVEPRVDAVALGLLVPVVRDPELVRGPCSPRPCRASR